MGSSGEADGRLTACRLAHELSLRWVDSELRLLAALRIRSITVVSVTVVAADIVMSAGLGGEGNPPLGHFGGIEGPLRQLSWCLG